MWGDCKGALQALPTWLAISCEVTCTENIFEINVIYDFQRRFKSRVELHLWGMGERSKFVVLFSLHFHAGNTS